MISTQIFATVFIPEHDECRWMGYNYMDADSHDHCGEQNKFILAKSLHMIVVMCYGRTGTRKHNYDGGRTRIKWVRGLTRQRRVIDLFLIPLSKENACHGRKPLELNKQSGVYLMPPCQRRNH